MTAQNLRSGSDVLRQLQVPGRLLAFVDDSGTAGKPLPALAAGFRVLCAVIIESAKYSELKTTVRAVLDAHCVGVVEFHATDIVNPASTSPWRAKSAHNRLACLTEMLTLVKTLPLQLLFGYVSKEQFDSELLPRLQQAGYTGTNHIAALEQAFLKATVKYVSARRAASAVVLDSRAAVSDAIRVRRAVGVEGLLESGVIEVDSRAEEGIQVADFVAFLLNRLHHVKHRAKRGRVGPFDGFAVDAIEALKPLLKDVFRE